MRARLWRRFDWHLFGLSMLLGLLGVLLIASALSGNEVLASWPWRQAAWLALGLLLLFAVAAIDYRLLASVAYPFYGLLLLFLVVIAVIGTVAGGAQRWLALGDFLFQPSELIKLGVILALAHFVSSREEKRESMLTPVVALLMLLPAVVLIYLQPNLSTAISLVVIGIVMLVLGGMRWRHSLILAITGGVGAIFAWRYLLQDYMRDRILMFVDPSKVPIAERYNIEQAMISVGSGGWLGRGLFSGSQSQLHFLRVRHTDFIFSVAAEELGFVGAVVLIILFVALLLRLIHIAGIARDTFGRLIVIGVTTMILLQFTVNVGMNLNLVPVTGMPLPFISYGGSSMLTVLIGIGLAESVAMRHKKIEFE